MRRVTITHDAIAPREHTSAPPAPIVAIIWAVMQVSPPSPVTKVIPVLLSVDGALHPVDSERGLAAADVVAAAEGGGYLIWSVLDPPKRPKPAAFTAPVQLAVPRGPFCPVPDYLPSFGGVRSRRVDDQGSLAVTPPGLTFNASARALAICNSGDAVVSTHRDDFLYRRVGEPAPTVTGVHELGATSGREIASGAPPLTMVNSHPTMHISPDSRWIAMTHQPNGVLNDFHVGVWTRDGELLFRSGGRTHLADALPWNNDSRRIVVHVREEVRHRLMYRWKIIDIVTGETEVIEEFDGVGIGRERPIAVPIGFADRDRLFVERVSEHRFDVGIWQRGDKIRWLLGAEDEGGGNVQQVTPTRALLAWE